MRILFIEDDRDFREVVTEFLEREGHEVLSAMDGDSGYRLLIEESPDAVILDQGMPGRSGTEWLESVRKDGRFRDLPILLMSGDAGIEEIAERHRMRFFLRKPPTLDELSRLLLAMGAARVEPALRC